MIISQSRLSFKMTIFCAVDVWLGFCKIFLGFYLHMEQQLWKFFNSVDLSENMWKHKIRNDLLQNLSHRLCLLFSYTGSFVIEFTIYLVISNYSTIHKVYAKNIHTNSQITAITSIFSTDLFKFLTKLSIVSQNSQEHFLHKSAYIFFYFIKLPLDNNSLKKIFHIIHSYQFKVM